MSHVFLLGLPYNEIFLSPMDVRTVWTRMILNLLDIARDGSLSQQPTNFSKFLQYPLPTQTLTQFTPPPSPPQFNSPPLSNIDRNPGPNSNPNRSPNPALFPQSPPFF